MVGPPGEWSTENAAPTGDSRDDRLAGSMSPRGGLDRGRRLGGQRRWRLTTALAVRRAEGWFRGGLRFRITARVGLWCGLPELLHVAVIPVAAETAGARNRRSHHQPRQEQRDDREGADGESLASYSYLNNIAPILISSRVKIRFDQFLTTRRLHAQDACAA